MGKDIITNAIVAAIFCAVMSFVANNFLDATPANMIIGGVINGVISAIAVTIVLYKKHAIASE